MNNKGQIIITDILLYLIVLTIILSLIVYATNTINQDQVSRVNNKEIQQLLEDNMETLTKTSGTPSNWEDQSLNRIEIVGLKSEKNQQISYEKLTRLKNNKQLLNNYFPDSIQYSLTLYPKDNPNNQILIAGQSRLTKTQVQSKNTQVIIDYGYRIIPVNNGDTNMTCPYNHDNQWKCKSITISKTLLDGGKYYIITDANTQYIISNTYSQNITGQTDDKTCINRQLEQLLTNQNQTIYIHTKTDTNNTCIVYDANNREEYLENVIKPEVYVLNMKIAT